MCLMAFSGGIVSGREYGIMMLVADSRSATAESVLYHYGASELLARLNNPF